MKKTSDIVMGIIGYIALILMFVGIWFQPHFKFFLSGAFLFTIVILSAITECDKKNDEKL